MKTCINCANVYLKKSNDDDFTRCTIGHWILIEGSSLPQVLAKHKDCGNWSLLEALRGTRGAKREW